MRGGTFCVAQRYSKASNKNIKLYNDNKPSKSIIYDKGNNILYKYTMSKSLSTYGLTSINIGKFDFNKCNDDSPKSWSRIS